MTAQTPNTESVLVRLSRPRIVAIARGLGLRIPASVNRAEQARRTAEVPIVDLRNVLAWFDRDELRDASTGYGLCAGSRARASRIERLANAAALALGGHAES